MAVRRWRAVVARSQESRTDNFGAVDPSPMFSCVVFFVAGRLVLLTYQSDKKYKVRFDGQNIFTVPYTSDQADIIFDSHKKLVDRTIVISRKYF